MKDIPYIHLTPEAGKILSLVFAMNYGIPDETYRELGNLFPDQSETNPINKIDILKLKMVFLYDSITKGFDPSEVKHLLKMTILTLENIVSNL